MTTAREVLEENGLTQTYWGQRIITAEEAGEFTSEDYDAAAGWTTCACGRLDDGIPRDDTGEPKDVNLRLLGLRFLIKVNKDNAVEAAEILVAIEKRAIEVLTELTKGETL